jgi:predicted NBD/HSP70 family sugar kinase
MVAYKKKTYFTTRHSADREKKNLLFLNIIKERKSTSRTEVSKLTDINIVTVSNYINSYIKKGLVTETGYDISSGGRRPELIELNRRWGYVVGVDVSEAETKGIMAGLNMEIIGQDVVSGTGWSDAKKAVDEVVQKLISQSKVDPAEVKKIGIGTSSGIDSARDSIVKAKEDVEGERGIPVLCGSGALCAAAGEKSLNPVALGAKSTLYVYGDLGQGVFIAGDEFFEASGDAPSYEYMKPWSDNLGVRNIAKKMVKDGVSTAIKDIAGGKPDNITLDTVLKAAKDKDEAAADLVRTTGINLGVRIAYLINLLEPESVIVGGGIEEAGDVFLNALKQSVERFITQRLKDKVTVSAAVSGRDACVKGAAFLALREALIEA